MTGRSFVNFDLATGVIRRIVRSNIVDCLPGYAVALYDAACGPVSDLTHVVDVTALIPDHDGNLCVSRFLAREPEPVTSQAIRSARDAELAATDALVSSPADRPDGAALRERWVPYRQALRDLGALPTASEMISAWPLRPDGSDPIANLRGIKQ